MSGDGTAETPPQRRARLDRVFGDVLPETTSDDRDEDTGPAQAREDELRRDVPPHHG